jgi:serine/threonine protein kinase
MSTPPQVLNSVVPEQLSAIILHLLEKEPDRRYQTADGLIYDLERLRRCPALSCPRSRQCMSRLFTGEIPHGHAVVEIANPEPLRGAMSGSSQGAVEIGCSERTVRRWVAAYRDHGEACLTQEQRPLW